MIVEPCKCGSDATCIPSYTTGSGGHGYAVICAAKHWGPQTRTERGAISLWNQWQRSPLTAEEIDAFIHVGATLTDALEITGP